MERTPAKEGGRKKGSWKRVFKKGTPAVDQPNNDGVSSTATTTKPSSSSTSKRNVEKSDQEQPPRHAPRSLTSRRRRKAGEGNLVETFSGPIDGDTLQPLIVPEKKKLDPLESSSSRPTATPRRRGDDKSKTRFALSREFERTSLPPKLARKWVVEVSPAEWDGDVNQWKYRILVQRRDISTPGKANAQSHGSFTNAFTWRSLADFCWLENALRAEFHGALMLPLLSIAIGTADLANTQYEVDAILLRDWLGDVFNGIRGQGELMLDMGSVDLLSSEAMEAFLYRNTDPLPIMDFRGDPLNKSLLPSTSSLDLPWKESPDRRSLNDWSDASEEDSFVNQLFTKPFSWLQLDSVCAGPASSGSEGTSPKLEAKRKGSKQPLSNHIPLEMMNCSSRAVGNSATLEMKDSFVESSSHLQQNSSKFAIHSELLEAERDLVLSYRRSALSSLEKLRVLSEEEAQIGAAWKRFAIALSNLFTFEREVESTRIGGKEKKAQMPYRKLRKRDVEDCLRVMARQKMERSTPSLRVLSMMLGAYVGDLSAVDPAIRIYSQAVVHLAGLDEAVTNANRHEKKRSSEDGDCGGQWHEQLRALASMQFGEVKRQFTGNSGTTATTDASSTDAENVAAQQKRAFEQRVLSNERLLRQSVTSLCRATPIRVARMAWKYYKMESGQAALLKGAAISMRTKVNVASAKTLSEMSERHETEDMADDEKELELVRRIVDIGNSKRYSANPQQSSVSGSESEASSEFENDEDEGEKVLLREKAIDIATHRTGLWDAKLALSIMEAVGINDAEVRVEETTRDLRLVRKHAIGLRENLSRCIEAVEILSSVILEGDRPDQLGAMSLEEDSRHRGNENSSQRGSRIHETRQGFMSEMLTLFSGMSLGESGIAVASKSASPSLRVLAGAGIDTSDPAGWGSPRGVQEPDSWRNSLSRGRCGKAALSYTRRMDVGVESLLQQISEVLDDYQTRVEGIESFVYMHCVGIQLEKHFSQKRSQTLAAWEKKTDITTAINIATRKGLPLLVKELQAKLDNLSPRNVSHTTVKETKEMHLTSKGLKTELRDLANRRFLRARETATHRVVTLMTLWAKYEQAATTEELNALGDVVEEIERTVNPEDIPHYLLNGSR